MVHAPVVLLLRRPLISQVPCFHPEIRSYSEVATPCVPFPGAVSHLVQRQALSGMPRLQFHVMFRESIPDVV